MRSSVITKRMQIMLIGIAILFFLIFFFKGCSSLLTKRSLSNQAAITPVSTMKVGYAAWQPKITQSGSLRAIRGVNVTTELAGMVQKIYFTPGSNVTEGTILVQLNADSEIGQLQALEANEELAKITYCRDKAQYAVKAISKQQLDTDAQNLKSLSGQVIQQAAIVAKKTIRAPFTGRLGVSNVNLGQYINTGDMIVTLQTLDPIWADFYVPQQALTQLKVGQKAIITTDALQGKTFIGQITTINPAIDVATRNVVVEATVANPMYELTPGMFATIQVETGKPKRYLTLPQTAISFNSYGDIVYIVKKTGTDKQGPILTAVQSFVITGETRGTQISILKGLKVGDIVVTSGQLKLKNGSRVMVNNAIAPFNSKSPVLKNEH